MNRFWSDTLVTTPGGSVAATFHPRTAARRATADELEAILTSALRARVYALAKDGIVAHISDRVGTTLLLREYEDRSESGSEPVDAVVNLDTLIDASSCLVIDTEAHDGPEEPYHVSIQPIPRHLQLPAQHAVKGTTSENTSFRTQNRRRQPAGDHPAPTADARDSTGDQH